MHKTLHKTVYKTSMVQVFFEIYSDFLKNPLHRSKNMHLKMHQICKVKTLYINQLQGFAYLHIFLDKVI